MAVAAIIVGDDENLSELTKRALADSSIRVAEIHLVSELSEASSLIARRASESGQAGESWIWLLAAGMQPAPGALAALLAKAETSPSAGWLAPKLVKAEKPREIEEFGLSVTSTWRPVSPVRNEFDQGQHDFREDLLAASLLGSLVRAAALSRVWPVKPIRRGLTGDYLLAINLRLSGYRVLAAADARILVGARSKNFENASHLELRKTQIELVSSYLNPALAAVLGIVAPALSILVVIWLLLLKRPERALPTVAAALWWFFSNPVLMARRPRLSKEQRAGLPTLRSLRATREDLQRLAIDGLELPSAVAESNALTPAATFGFAASGGLWVMVLLTALSFRFWPSAAAVTSQSLLPLGDNLAHLFSRAGASWQNSGLGFAAPSDPFNWVLLALGLITFWAPNLGATLFIFLVKPLAFASAWRLLSLVSKRGWIVSLGALLYAFWPALNQAQESGQLGSAVALVLSPLFVFTLARILQFGSASRRSVQTWTWVGIGGLLAAAISASSPGLMPLVAAVILLLALYRFRRIGYVIWLPLPMLAIFAPYAWYLISGVVHPLMLFSDPGLPVSVALLNPVTALMGGQQLPLGSGWTAWLTDFAVAIPVLIALAGTFTNRALNALWLWLAAAAAVSSGLLFNRLVFAHYAAVTGVAESAGFRGNPNTLLGLAGLLIVILVVLALEHSPKLVSVAGQIGSLVFVLIFGVQTVLVSPSLNWTDGSVMPALVQAQAQLDPQTRVLVVRSIPSDGTSANFDATLVTGSGLTMEDLSTAYSASQTKLHAQDSDYSRLGRLSAALIAGSDNNLDSQLRHFSIDYVLVPDPIRDSGVSAALDSLSQLEQVGTTDFGRLWRIKSDRIQHRKTSWEWSLTKEIQVAVLVIFALLAIPTRRRQKYSGEDELALDDFEPVQDGDGF